MSNSNVTPIDEDMYLVSFKIPVSTTEKILEVMEACNISSKGDFYSKAAELMIFFALHARTTGEGPGVLNEETLTAQRVESLEIDIASAKYFDDQLALVRANKMVAKPLNTSIFTVVK